MDGKVKFFSDDKNFGFIIGDNDEEYFVHSTQVLGDTMLEKDDKVEFEVVEGQKGLAANNVKLK